MYSQLYVKTEFSLLSSLIKIDDLLLNCQKKKITSCAIVDDNLFGTMEFIKKCEKYNINPIIGLEIKLENDIILLYAKNIDGYHNLVHIETIKNDLNVTSDLLKKYSNDLICICFNKNMFTLLNHIYSNIYVGVNSKNTEEEAKSYTNDIVFINKTLYLEKYEYKYLPYVFMIRDGKTISDGIDFVYQNNYLMNYSEIINLVDINTINNTLKISDMCSIKFTKKLYMPSYNTFDSKDFLIKLSNKGLLRRLNNEINDKYQSRLNYELDIIIKMHFEDYFLVVYDYIKFAKKNDILVGPGRGSAAGSLVCYSLGITDIDPIKYNLLFERFLNPERITMPDIDTDFPDEDRDKVINYVINKYGISNVAGIITFGTLKAKQAIRDVGRILNISLKDIDFLCKKLENNESLKNLRKRNIEINNYIESDDKLLLLSNIVNIIENNKRHTSIHAAGIVISYEKLDNILPIIKRDNMYLTEYTMEYLEELGLIKMDFLGLKNLSIIKDIIDKIKISKNISIDLNNIPLDDINTIKLFKTGNTTGIFQFESTGMKKFLIDLDPNTFSEISAANALYRPGPSANIPSFVKRKKGIEKIDYFDPSLKNILQDTYGIIIYQEQIMQIANKMANYSLGEADILRRAMSKKKLEILNNEKEKFINSSIANGYSKEKSEQVYDLILKFANYGFNKSHSICYSLIAYRMAYLKANYPTYFYSSILKGVIGSEVKTQEYLNELKKLGIKILPPDINESDCYSYKVTDNKIILPLAVIRNVGGVIANYIVEERKKGIYKDIYDFLRRIYKNTNNINVIQSLIYSHAFDNLGLNITTLINNLDTITNYIELTVDLDNNVVEKPVLNNYPNNYDDILEHEHILFGFYLTSHKTEKYKLNYNNIIDINEAISYFNKNINIIVSVDKIKEIQTKTGDKMCFITGIDNTGQISITLFPKLYNLLDNINKNDILLVSGVVEKRFNEYQVIANKIMKLN